MRDIRMQPACQHCGYGNFTGIPSYLLNLPRLQTVAHEKQARISPPWKEAAPVMLTRFFKGFSLVISRLAAFLDTSEKLYPDRLAYKHELNNLEITDV